MQLARLMNFETEQLFVNEIIEQYVGLLTERETN